MSTKHWAIHLHNSGDAYVIAIHEETRLLRAWLEYLGKYEITGTANSLILGVQSSIVEVAACLSAGFARVAVGSLRAQIDLVLSWLYFKDHPVEFQRLERTGDGFMQKSELTKYLSEKLSTAYGTRFGVLKQCAARKIDDPFSLLSAHLHKQSTSTLESLTRCEDAICDIGTCKDVVALQSYVSEYLNDVLLSCYAHKWASLPSDILSIARSRMTSEQERVLFS